MALVGDEPEEGGGDVVVDPGTGGIVVFVLGVFLDMLRRSGEGSAGGEGGERAAEGRRGRGGGRRRRGGTAEERVVGLGANGEGPDGAAERHDGIRWDGLRSAAAAEQRGRQIGRAHV